MPFLKNTCTILFLLISIELSAQSHLLFYSDIGKSQVSQGVYLKSSIQGQYEYKKFFLSSGIENTLIGTNPRFISGVTVNAGREFYLKSVALKIQGLYSWNNSANLIRENNYGVFLQLRLARFNTEFGTHFRNLYYSKQAIKDYSLQYQTSIYENWNMIYAFDFFLKPQNHSWNIGLGATNRDYFTISQETNPLFYVRGTSLLKNGMTLFLETWYKSSGAFNASVNYFGLFVRTGIKWQIITKN